MFAQFSDNVGVEVGKVERMKRLCTIHYCRLFAHWRLADYIADLFRNQIRDLTRGTSILPYFTCLIGNTAGGRLLFMFLDLRSNHQILPAIFKAIADRFVAP